MIAEALAKPIIDMIDQAGTGVLPCGGPPDELRGAAAGIRSALDTGVMAAGAIGSQWRGADADACACTASGAAQAGEDLSAQAEGIAAVVEDAAACVQRGVAELGGILESFLAVVACQGPALATPVGQVTVLAAAADHIEQALTVVGRMRGELEVRAGEMARFIPDVPLPAAPNPDIVGQLASHVQGAVSGAASDAADGVRSWAAGVWGDVEDRIDGFFADTGDAPGGADCGEGVSGADGAAGDGSAGDDGAGDGSAGDGSAGDYGAGDDCAGDGAGDDGGGAVVGAAGAGEAAGAGMPVTLPDGTTVTAPNASAADAVQAALSQRGVPYSWGGEAPGQGMDCSGLTQWAYGQAGVDLPRLAQAQTMGEQIPAGQIAPGDLAVWDGHVAMVVGDGRMIEAGDPVTVDPVRTTNGGMQFRGFFRPTSAM